MIKLSTNSSLTFIRSSSPVTLFCLIAFVIIFLFGDKKNLPCISSCRCSFLREENSISFLRQYRQYHCDHNNHTGLLYDFLCQLCYRLSMDILQSLYQEYVYDPFLLKKCSHKDKPIVEIPISKKIHRKKINSENKSKVIEIHVNYRYVNQKCKNICSHLPIMVTHLPTICSVIAFRQSVR